MSVKGATRVKRSPFTCGFGYRIRSTPNTPISIYLGQAALFEPLKTIEYIHKGARCSTLGRSVQKVSLKSRSLHSSLRIKVWQRPLLAPRLNTNNGVQGYQPARHSACSRWFNRPSHWTSGASIWYLVFPTWTTSIIKYGVKLLLHFRTNGGAVMGNFTPHVPGHLISYPYWNWN